MLKAKLSLVVGAALGLTVGAQAFIYSNLTYTAPGAFTPNGIVGQTGGQSLTVSGPATTAAAPGIIDFFPTNWLVGSSTGVASATYTFTYDVDSLGAPIGSNGLQVLGIINGRGTIAVTESVVKLVGGIPTGGPVGTYAFSFNASTVNANLTRSANNFTLTDSFNLSPTQTTYRVTKQFTLSVGAAGFDPTVDHAGITLIEQNHNPVPEPATLAALGIGALAAIRRRKK